MLAAGLILAGTASAAPGVERPKFKNLRFEEDWSTLPDAEGPEHPLDPIKYIRFDDAGRFWLSFGGQLRGRVEIWEGFRFGDSQPKDDDAYMLGRVRLHADLHLTEYFRTFVEFKSAIMTDRELAGGRRPTLDEDVAALQNAIGEFRYPFENFEVGLQGGRRELQFGAQRLVSPLDWANVRRTFDNAGAFAAGDGWEASGFWSMPVKVRRRQFNKSSTDRQFYGLHGVFDVPATALDLDLGVDLYWFGLHLDDPRANNGTTGTVDRHTMGGRIYGKIPYTPLRIDFEGAGQFGEVGSGSIGAGIASLLITWPFDDVFLEPAVYVGYDWASGDKRPGGDVQTFDQLFPLGHKYLGYMDYIGRQNIQAVQGGAKIHPIPRMSLELTWHSFWLMERNDALYDAGGNRIRFDPLADSKHVGTEVDFAIRYTFITGLSTFIGYSHFFPGDYLDGGPNRSSNFGYIELQYTF